MRGWRRRCNLLLLACLSGPRLAAATTVRYLDLPALVARADLVVLATPLTQEVAWEGSHLVTLHQLAIREIWHAAGAKPRGPLWVATLGGSLGEVGQRAGDPALPLRRPLVLHLRRDRVRPGRFAVVGAQQGIWHLAASDPAEDTPVRQAVDALRMGAPVHLPEAPRTLGALRQAVRELAPHVR